MRESIVVVGAALSADVDAPTERVHCAPAARRGQPAALRQGGPRHIDCTGWTCVLPSGFIYEPQLLSEDEERTVLGEIGALPFTPVEFRGFTAKRRAIHYGVGYDFADRAVAPAPRMPDFLLPIRERYSITFRSVLAVILLVFLFASSALAQKPDASALETTIQRIAAAARGRVGVALIHLESGTAIHVRGYERFPMASIVKLPIGIEVLKQVSEGKLTLDRAVWLGASDIRPCCAIERRHPKGGVSRTVEELLELSIIESDNTAADALLKLVGGADVVERRLRTMGFHLINVDRTEGQLLLDMAGVTNAPPPEQWTIEIQRQLLADADRETVTRGRARYLADERDTATPYETAQLLGRLQLGDLLPPSETELLMTLMLRTKTGPRRIKGRLPPETQVAHKTGTTAVVINDVGVITLPLDSKIPGRLVVAVYIANGSSIAAMERTVAQIGAAAFEFFTGRTIPPRPVQRRRRRS